MKKPCCKICKKPLFRSTAKVCSVACAIEYNLRYPEKVQTFIKKIQKEENRKWQKQKKVIKKKLKTLGGHEGEARRVFQRWIRVRDQELPCVSCGTNYSRIWDAGHFLKAELFSGLIFDPDNVHKQCRKCNYYLDGNEANYRMGLVKRYGEQFVTDLEARKDRLRQYTFTKDELDMIKEKYAQKLKEAKRAA